MVEGNHPIGTYITPLKNTCYKPGSTLDAPPHAPPRRTLECARNPEDLFARASRPVEPVEDATVR